ncbi:uncharacterized protein LOC126281313 [Schistocerca gregaria]|uniref:uncharacterized protein LOC126281313 n=1 Tax=Schistocerca gregaria TaxID=7010 RepID=UPI00211E95A4|nr:uncharacterized protein LOC126281313 [Schistocerca gregaria]XP_049836116.1 uncharacterized protein LOC126281313 [Schistocerca gregaria]
MVLRTATARLVAALLAAWVCAAAGAGRCPPGCRCSPDGLSASCVDLQADRLPQGLAPTLSTLDVSHHRLRAVDGRTFADLPQLQTLDVSRGRITQVSDGAFHGLARLHQLVLSDNWLTSVPVDAFPASLLELDLSNNPLSLPTAGPFLRAEGITTLNLSHCAVTSVGDDVFSQMPSLVQLDLRGNPLNQLSPLAFLGLRQLFVDEGSLGVHTYAVKQVVQDVVEVPRIGATTLEDFTPEQQLHQGDPLVEDPPSVYDDPETDAYTDSASNGAVGWQKDTPVFNDFSSLFGPVPQDAADSNLFKGAPFQATGEVTVVYAADLKNLKDTLLVLAALAVLCFLLAALQRAVDGARAARGRRRCLLDACSRGGRDRQRPPQQSPDDGDFFWWDTETSWSEAGKPRSGDLPPPYPYPPTYEDSLTVTVTPNSNCDGQADSATRVWHQPASVHQARGQPDAVDNSRVSRSADA